MIHIEDIQPGMILSCDLKDRSGRVLLGTGSLITEKHLKILKMWGITEADIQGVDQESVVPKGTIEITPVWREEVETDLSRLFRHTDRQHSFIRELFRLLASRRALHHPEEEDHAS